MNRTAYKFRKVTAAAILLLITFPLALSAQQNSNDPQVYLSFTYHGFLDTHIPAYYKNDQFYLPVSDLFKKLKIFHEVDQNNQTITGKLSDKNFTIDFREQIAKADDKEIALQSGDLIISNIDYFLRPGIFKKLLGLGFDPDFNSLTLDLKTNHKLPVVVRHQQKQKRRRIDQQNPFNRNEHYPLGYNRQRNIFNGGFLDYNLMGIYTQYSNIFTFTNALGLELLGGDLSGNVYGTFSDDQKSVTTSGLRWRYVKRNNDYFSNIVIGQTFNEGINNRAITGFRISNRPIEPRERYDRYIVNGSAPPQSDVELYLNNQLVDYKEADQNGHYQFPIPLTYGSNMYSLRIYKPNGQTVEQQQRIQIPFTFVPPGEIDYSLSGGRLQNSILGSTKRGFAGAATVSTGLTDWLTGKVSTEYLSDYHDRIPAFTGTLNARLFTNYLLSANFNSENFYRITSSVLYSSGANWSLSYEYNPGNSRLYNIAGNDQVGRFSFFTPLNLGSIPINIRWSSTYQQRNAANQLRYRAYLSTRLGRLNVRFGYQDQQTGSIGFTTTSSARITNSYTYSLDRMNMPGIMEGLYLDAQLAYLPGFNQLEETEIQLSRDFFDTGRIRFSYGHNFLGDFNFLSLNLSIDFSDFRSRTSSRYYNDNATISQSFRGSVGFDPQTNQALFSNRQQVGQAGAAVRLYVDQNNDGIYQREDDKLIKEPAVTVGRAAGETNLHNGINYVSHMKSYYRYNMEINSSALKNPLLTPSSQKFSIVTDPNQYKTINIPFYQSGVVSGKVTQIQDSTDSGVSGIRIFLESAYEDSTQNSFSKELRTFTDGSFYTYKVPPGKYNLYVDPDQLEFLNSVSKPDTLHIEIDELAKGDFVENLELSLVSKSDTSGEKEKPQLTEKTKTGKSVLSDQELYYKVQLASFSTLEKAKEVAIKATRRLGGNYSLVKNAGNGLYAIRSNPIPRKEQAVENVISYHNKDYNSAAVVMLKGKRKKRSISQTKYIQIGAFKYKENAKQFAENASYQLNRETAIAYNSESDLFKVYLSKRISTRKERKNLLDSIRNQFSFQDAFINDSGHIQLAAYVKKRDAETLSDLIEMVLQLKTGIEKDTQYDMYDVFLDREFDSLGDKQSQLQKIKRQTALFDDAFVSNFADTAGDSLPRYKKQMRFHYKLQLNNISSENQKALIDEIKIDYPQISANRSQNGSILFTDISNWEVTDKLRDKISEIAPQGRFVIILVEKDDS